MQILSYHQTSDFDRIRFRSVPFTHDGEVFITIVEEKMKGERVVADSRRQLSMEMFASLRKAVLSVEFQ